VDAHSGFSRGCGNDAVHVTPSARAIGAVKRSIICARWHMLSCGEFYRDLGGNWFRRRGLERQAKRLVAQPERLGHTATLREVA